MSFRSRCTRAAPRWLALLAIACIPAVVAAAQSPLTLGEAQRLAVDRSRELGAQVLGVAAAREMAVSAGQLPDPVISLGIENFPADGADRFNITRDFMTMRRIGVMQELTSGDKLRLRAERFELEAQKGLAEQAATLASIQRDAALAWFDASFAARVALAVADQRARALQEVTAAEAAYRAGKGTQADVFMAQGATAMLDDRAAGAQRSARSARTLLARWTGESADRPLAPMPDLGTLRMGASGVHDELAGHPEIVALARREAIAETEARIAQAARWPDWTVQLAYSLRGPAYSNMISLGVSIPFPWDRANRQDRDVAAKLAVAAQAGAQRDEALRKHSAEVLVMEEEWTSNRDRLVRYEREIIPLAVARADATLAAYRGGKSGVGEVLAARRNELEARLQALQLEAETARLWAQLNYLFPEESK